MIPISFWCNARKRVASLKVDGFVSFEWKNGEMTTRVLEMPLSLFQRKEKTQLFGFPPARWSYLKGMLSFLARWKIKRMEGTFSLPDPMTNGVLYGWMSALQAREADRKVAVTINFLGDNWLKGEFAISLKTLFHHLKSWIYPLIREMRQRKISKGGE